MDFLFLLNFPIQNSSTTRGEGAVACENASFSLWKRNIPAHVLFAGVLPKSSNPAHIADNIRIFDWELDAASMQRLSNDLEAAHHFCWNPQNVK